MMTDEEIIAVVQAHKEGKTIEYRISGHGLSHEEGWGNPTSGLRMEWNFKMYDYRVVPEPRKPREWVCILFPDGTIRPFNEPFEIPTFREGKSIRVREVLE